MAIRQQKLAIALPVSIISEIPHLREKTVEIGLIARAAAIFWINEIIIFSVSGTPYETRRGHCGKTQRGKVHPL